MVWLKRRIRSDADGEVPARLFGAVLADGERHPIRRMSTEACTPQLGVAGPWFDRLPHFRVDHTPSAGAELQTEYFVPREHAVGAFLALDGLRDRIAPLIQVSEVRTIAADELWLSMANGRPSVALHFTWQPDWEAVRGLLPAIELALRPFEPRPHWGKLFTLEPDELRSRYDRLPAFVSLARRLDPAGTFRNAFLDRYLDGG
jgi:xylitol oxidase